MSFLNWFRSLTTWIRGFAATKELPPPILETHESDDGLRSLHLIYDESSDRFPGIVAAWHLIPQPETLGRYLTPILHEYSVNQHWLAVNLGMDLDEMNAIMRGEVRPDEQQLFFIARRFGLPIARLRSSAIAPYDLLIIVANVAQWREEVGKLNFDESEHWKRRFEAEARRELELQKHILGTHLFLTGWISKEPFRQRVVDGRVQHYKHIDPGATYFVDLQGLGSPWVGTNKYAEKIVRAIALRALQTGPSRLNSWEDLFRQMNNLKLEYNWRSWLEFYAKKYISPEHVLQPKRMRRDRK